MSNLSNRGKIVKKGATVRVPMIARGPVFQPIVDALHNPFWVLTDPDFLWAFRLSLGFFWRFLGYFSRFGTYFGRFLAISDVFSAISDVFFGYFWRFFWLF